MIKTGKAALSVAGNLIANVTKCSLEYSQETIEVNGVTDASKKRIAGLRHWSLSAESMIEFAGNSGHAQLINAMNEGLSVSVDFRLDDSNILTGIGFIDSLSLGINAGESAAISINITGSGALTLKV